MIADGTFRKDLYHRLKVFSFELPPLRTHREDLQPLVDYFIGRYPQAVRPSITEDFLSAIALQEGRARSRVEECHRSCGRDGARWSLSARHLLRREFDDSATRVRRSSGDSRRVLGTASN